VIKLSETTKTLTVATLAEKLEKMMNDVQKSQQKTDTTLSVIMNEILEININHEFLSCIFEEMKNELQAVKRHIEIYKTKITIYKRSLQHCKREMKRPQLN